MQSLMDVISEKTGLDIREQDIKKLDEIVSSRMKLFGIPSLDEYYEILKTGNDRAQTEWRELTNRLTTGETYFFRDKGQFALLEVSILPELIELRKGKKVLRIWSAGCSTGEEPYSIAIIIDKLIADRKGWNMLIFGTDINEEAIKRARQGRYGEWSFRQVGDEVRKQYFQKKKDEWVLDDRIREMVSFEIMNLIRDEYPDYGSELYDIDLILCRNVFIYFEPKIVSEVVDKMAAKLSGGGYLMTGHAELRGQNFPYLKVRVFPESVVYQKSMELGARSEESKPEIRIQKPTESRKLRVSKPKEEEKEVLAFEQLVSSQRPTPDSQLKEARSLADMGRYEEAIKICEEATKADPFSTIPYFLLSQIAREKGDIEIEKEMLKKVIYLDPLHITSFLNLAIMYDSEGDNEKASKMRNTALELLKKMPPDVILEPYTFTAGELIEHVEKMVK